MAPRTRTLWLVLFVSATVSAQPIAAGLKSGMDASVLPGDNFFLYANGSWLKATEIPPDQASWGVDAFLAEEAARHTSELLDAASAAPSGTDARKAGDYYASYMDESGIEAQGLAPFQPALARIAS